MRLFITALVPLVFLGCGDSGDPLTSAPPDISIRVLLAAPDTVVVDGRTLTLSANLWRDFMPTTEPNGSKLIAVIYIQATDTAKLPDHFSPDAVWIVNGQEVWRSSFTSELLPWEQRPNRFVKIARDGPLWDGYVDVVTRIFDSLGKGHLLRAAHQYINRVY